MHFGYALSLGSWSLNVLSQDFYRCTVNRTSRVAGNGSKLAKVLLAFKELNQFEAVAIRKNREFTRENEMALHYFCHVNDDFMLIQTVDGYFPDMEVMHAEDKEQAKVILGKSAEACNIHSFMHTTGFGVVKCDGAVCPESANALEPGEEEKKLKERRTLQ
jgi:hypothetical protein